MHDYHHRYIKVLTATTVTLQLILNSKISQRAVKCNLVVNFLGYVCV